MGYGDKPNRKPQAQSPEEKAAVAAFTKALREAIELRFMDERGEIGLAVARFAVHVGINPSQINQYRGGRQPTFGRALLLAKAAGISLDALMRELPAATWDGVERRTTGGGPSEGGDEPRRPGPVDPNDPHGVGPQRSPSRSSRRAGDSG